MKTVELLDELQNKAKKDPVIRQALLDTRQSEKPVEIGRAHV